jgi:hypothetical protein
MSQSSATHTSCVSTSQKPFRLPQQMRILHAAARHCRGSALDSAGKAYERGETAAAWGPRSRLSTVPLHRTPRTCAGARSTRGLRTVSAPLPGECQRGGGGACAAGPNVKRAWWPDWIDPSESLLSFPPAVLPSLPPPPPPVLGVCDGCQRLRPRGGWHRAQV